MMPDDARHDESNLNRMPNDILLRFFEYQHLPTKLQEASRPFHDLAQNICFLIAPSAERTVALRKLLESKDAAVRASLPPSKSKTEV